MGEQVTTGPTDISDLFTARTADRPEIVIGLVGALGVDLKAVTSSLRAALVGVAYEVHPVRVSELISDFCQSEGVSFESVTTLDHLMDLGDALRIGGASGAVAAALAVGAISHERPPIEGSPDEPAQPYTDVTAAPIYERNAYVSIVRQLKHPEEVEALRAVYGPRFVMIGVWAPEKDRRREVERRLRKFHPTESDAWYAEHVSALVDRDEKDGRQEDFGQRVRDTYKLADAYLAMTDDGRSLDDQTRRLVHLLFGSPFETPLPHELAMYQASGASLRSSDAGRQVGAVIVDEDGEIVVTGSNEVPKAGGGQYWPNSEDDRRDFRYGYDVNENQKSQIVVELLATLRKEGWLVDDFSELTDEELGARGLAGPLASTRIADLLEFGRVAHAEMAAICTAARRGVSIRNLTMYTTTYPCHECARLIIAAGIRRVVYVDPYPKSQVATMYQHEISEDLDLSRKVVVFEPYQGVAPRLFRGVFTMTGRKRDASGEYPEWVPDEARPRLIVDATSVPQPITAEKSLYQGTVDKLVEVDWTAIKLKAAVHETDVGADLGGASSPAAGQEVGSGG